MNSTKLLFSLSLIITAGMGLSACGGDGARDTEDTSERNAETETETETETNAESDGKITGLWGGTVLGREYLFLIADHGTKATVYDCIANAESTFEVGVGAENVNHYVSEDVDADGVPVLGFVYSSSANTLKVEFGAIDDINDISGFLNFADLKLEQQTSNNKFSLNAGGNAPNQQEIKTVCGGSSLDNGAAIINIIAPYGDELIKFDMSFRGGANASTENSIGTAITASMGSRGFRETTVASLAVDFTAGNIQFDTCTADLIEGSYSLSYAQGTFTGVFLLEDLGMDVCETIDIYSTEPNVEPVTPSEGGCSDSASIGDITGVWNLDFITRLLANTLLSDLQDEVDDSVDLSQLINVGLIIADNSGSDGEGVVTLGICQAPAAADLIRNGDQLVISGDLEDLAEGLESFGNITIDDDESAISVDVGLKLKFHKRDQFDNEVCMVFDGMDKLPQSSITCIDEAFPPIASASDPEQSVFTLAVVNGEDIYHIVMEFGITIQVGAYSLGSQGVAVTIYSSALKNAAGYGGFSTIEMDSGVINIIEKSANHVKGSLELVYSPDSGSEDDDRNIYIDFNSRIY